MPKNNRKNVTRKNRNNRNNRGPAARKDGGAKIPAVGSKVQVWNGTAKHTSGGLRKGDLMKNKGRIVSKKKHAAGKKAIKHLIKLGYKAKKGTFKLFKKGKRGGFADDASGVPMGFEDMSGAAGFKNMI
jgi:hypothetical protein